MKICGCSWRCFSLYLDGQVLLGDWSKVLGGKHAGHPWRGPRQGHLPRPPLLHLLHHLPIDELPLLLTGSQRPAQSFSIFEFPLSKNFPRAKTRLPLKSYKMPQISFGEPHANKELASILRLYATPHHTIKLYKTRQMASLVRSEALCLMSCPACLHPVQILTTSGTRTQGWDAYCLRLHKKLLDGHLHAPAYISDTSLLYCTLIFFRAL